VTAGLPPTLRFVLRRLAFGVLLALATSILIFVGSQALSSDPARGIAGPQATPQTIHAIREQLQLDKPITTRYIDWLGGVVHGDFGKSLVTGTSVRETLQRPATNTLVLAAAAMLLLVPLGLALGIAAGINPGSRLDSAITSSTLAWVAMPEFVAAALLIVVLSTSTNLLPGVSLPPPGETALATPKILILPALALVGGSLAWIVRFLRASIVELMQSPFVEMARLNGVNERRIVLRHVLPLALPAALQSIAAGAVSMIAGTIVVETIFSYPGVGQLLAHSVATRDLPIVQAVALLATVATLIAYLLADLFGVLLVPSLRTAAR
jgi:peptide/nickel transport system permease protein